MNRGKIGGHSQPGLIQPTADSNPYGLRNVLRHSDGTERTEFPLQSSCEAAIREAGLAWCSTTARLMSVCFKPSQTLSRHGIKTN